MQTVDLNCDMGEGCPNDASLMDYVSSVNVACGFHAGDAETMKRTVAAATQKNVAIGAHPSFPDRENFGRTAMSLPAETVYEIITTQIETLNTICRIEGAELSHVKPHGALYNQAARDTELAAAIAKAVRDTDPSLVLYGLSGSVSITEAERLGLTTASETFADRTYRSDGSLTPRSEPNALIDNTSEAARQALSMAANGIVTATNGTDVNVKADTICIHGDGEHALDFAKAIKENLLMHNIAIRPVNG